MAEFCMPSLGADMENGILVEWKVKPGDRVKRGDIIAEVETEKGIIEIEVFVDGLVEQLLVKPGETVPVGAVMAIISSKKEYAPPVGTEPQVEKIDEKKRSPDQPPEPAPKYKACSIAKHRETHPLEQPLETKPLVSDGGNRLRISPSARKLATELAIDLTTVYGTGPEGAINRADVEQAAQTKKKAKKESKKAPAPSTGFQDKMRQAIAAAMARSNKDIPHYYLETRIDMSHALQWLEMENRKRSIKERLLPAVLMIKAVALALGDVPELNGYWIDNQHQPREGIHIGFAISLRQGGLIAPAIHDADLKSLDELMEGLRDLIIRTRAGRLRSSEMTDATITLTNLGDLGVETVYGVIYPPQLALVGFGKIMEQPWAENGMLGIRQVLKATLSADHRATDGRKGAQFLDALNRYLQEADKL